MEQDAVTRQEYDRVRTACESAEARYAQLSRAKGTAVLAKDEQSHRLAQSRAAVSVAEAALDLARLNLSYTAILAPCDGVTGAKDIHAAKRNFPASAKAQKSLSRRMRCRALLTTAR